MKLLWSGIKSIINLKSTHSSVISQLKAENGNITADPLIIAEISNELSVNASSRVTKMSPTMKSPLNFLKNGINMSFFIYPSVPMGVADGINLLKSGKCVSPNSISIELLKILSPYVCFPLCQTTNDSFQSGAFPENMIVS